MNKDQAVVAMRAMLQDIVDGKPQKPEEMKALMLKTDPAKLVESYNMKDAKSARYDYIMRWFRRDLEYKLGCREHDDLGCLIDDNIEKDVVTDDKRRAAHADIQHLKQTA